MTHLLNQRMQPSFLKKEQEHKGKMSENGLFRLPRFVRPEDAHPLVIASPRLRTKEVASEQGEIGKPIFSVDIHPDGSRFATGGQGEDAGKIIIWNMAPVRTEEAEKTAGVPKILCEMDNHLACVNCVRWSNSGRFLASGADDKLVMIWQISKYGVGASVFGSDSKIIESWRPAHTLRGHSGDVLDLAWAPGDIWLATCSIDNTVIVWNTDKLPEQVAVLKGHTGLVKGVCWDPVGKYLASQSDDRSLIVWRTRDWQQEAVVTEPFKECGGTTHVLRCDWSPDGHYVVSAHAMNNSGPTAQIVERDGWKTSLDFVGHRKAITVVRFNPGILSKKFKKDSSKSQQYTCCAIGSRDRSLSIWLTALKRPLVVTHDLFTNSVLDISWGHTGCELLCCSCDGTVAYIQFKPDEIGTPMNNSEMNHLLEKIYGKTVTKSTNSSSANQIIESADILKLQQQQQQKQNGIMSSPEEKQRTMSNSSLMSTPSKSASFYNGVDMTGSPFKPTDKQIETKTPDGRRRITPIFLPVEPDVGAAPAPFIGNAQIQFETSRATSSIQVEKQNKVTLGGLMSPPAENSNISPLLTSKPPVNQSTPKTNASSSRSPVGGERSIDAVVQPLSALDKPESSQLTATPKASTKHHTPDKGSEKKKHSLSLKRKHDEEDQPKKRGRPRLIDKEKPKSTPTSTPVLPSSQTVERETVRYVASSSDLNLPVPTIDKHHSFQVIKDSGDDGLALEVENYVHSGGVTLHKVKCLKGGNTEWEQVLSSQIIALAGSKYTSCVACSDGTVSVFNTIGQKVFPSIMLGCKASIVDVNGHNVMVVTRKGGVHVWDVKKNTCLVKNEQLSSVMKGTDVISKAVLNSKGLPVITLTNHKSYIFSTDLQTWLLVQDRNDRVIQCSTHFHTKPKLTSKLAGTLTSLQYAQERAQGSTQRVVQSGAETRQLCTLNHLESQVQSSLCMGSAGEYKFWLQTYVRYLVQEGVENRLREICSDFLGPVYKTSNKNLWEKTVLGLNKRELLKELLPLFSENLKTLQRLYTEIQEQLDIVEDVT